MKKNSLDVKEPAYILHRIEDMESMDSFQQNGLKKALKSSNSAIHGMTNLQMQM